MTKRMKCHHEEDWLALQGSWVVSLKGLGGIGEETGMASTERLRRHR